MNVVFVTDLPIPYGMAATNRLLSLATGIRENGCKVNILIFNPTENKNNPKNLLLNGSYKDVQFQYLPKTTILPESTFVRFFIYISGLFKLLRVLRKIHAKSPIDAIILSHSWSIYTFFLFFFFIRLNKVLLLQERNEYPFLNKDKSLFRRLDYFLYLRFALKRFDGLMVITYNLKEFFVKFLRENTSITVIPMTVEPDRFENVKKDPLFRYIAYCGSLDGNKDGVYNLIEAFSLISSQFPDYLLYIIGDAKNKNEMEAIQRLAKNKKLENRVIFTGRVGRDDIPLLLKNAEVLALARPSSIQAEGGFPTKLGEYLATGNPVIVTKVGEIPDYLINGENAYLANPDDIPDFARQLSKAISESEESNRIGENGKKLALSVFNYRVQGKNIIDFIKQIQDE